MEEEEAGEEEADVLDCLCVRSPPAPTVAAAFLFLFGVVLFILVVFGFVCLMAGLLVLVVVVVVVEEKEVDEADEDDLEEEERSLRFLVLR